MRIIARVAVLALCAGLLSCGASRESASSADTTPQLRRDGRFLVDAQNRVVLLHGVNLVWKEAPYVPPADAEGFTAADADWLAQHGFNAARIGVLWTGVMPDAPGVVDHAYLDAWHRVVELLASRRIWMLFDFHQDMLGPIYQGEGVPPWAVDAVVGDLTALLGAPSLGFPFNYFTPQVSQSFDNLWKNDGAVRDGFRDAWVAVARRWKDQPYSMGYNLFNEPWAGLEYPSCLIPLLGCPAHDRKELQPFFEYALAGIRSVDPHQLVWFESEPQGSSLGTPKGFVPVDGETQLGYSFHYYCPLAALTQAVQLGLLDALPVSGTCAGFARASLREARDQAERMNGVELLTEFGATDDLDILRQTTAAADAQLIGWQYWQYKNWRDPTTTSQGSGAQGLFADDTDPASAKADKLRVLVRTYPQATAGIPQALSFDPDTAVFEYRYTPRAAAGPTQIYVPLAVHYPHGYRVELSGARVRSAPDAALLELDNDDGATQVEVRIEPR
ncbi:cellulase family glycosylhydrolase [Solimonas flava]|uniref:cellulase family glycosylhydrolase n=1 Tax=Solimonas flava TaxID=415849 RepID=UPI001FE0A209|nr:cellulase family glycosylhydrolase [Solimonas flava]